LPKGMRIAQATSLRYEAVRAIFSQHKLQACGTKPYGQFFLSTSYKLALAEDI